MEGRENSRETTQPEHGDGGGAREIHDGSVVFLFLRGSCGGGFGPESDGLVFCWAESIVWTCQKQIELELAGDFRE